MDKEEIVWEDHPPTDIGWYWFDGGPLIAGKFPPGRYRVKVVLNYGMLCGFLDGHAGGWMLDFFKGRWSGPIEQPADYKPRTDQWDRERS